MSDIDYLHEARQNVRVTLYTDADYLARARAFALIAIAESLREIVETGYL